MSKLRAWIYKDMMQRSVIISQLIVKPISWNCFSAYNRAVKMLCSFKVMLMQWKTKYNSIWKNQSIRLCKQFQRQTTSHCSGKPKKETCASTPPPCFPGVNCMETADGVRCGPCPRGYIGNGRTCRPGISCADRPCFPGNFYNIFNSPHFIVYTDFKLEGVRCVDTENGAQCGPCPAGYVGDGQRCRPDNACKSNPCFSGWLLHFT